MSKFYAETLHRAIIDRLTAHFREVRHKLQTDAQIKIRFGWRVYLQRKRIKKEKKKAAAAKKNAKKGKYGAAPPRRPTQSLASAKQPAVAKSATVAIKPTESLGASIASNKEGATKTIPLHKAET